VLSDVKMPDTQGVSILDDLLAVVPPACVILMTAHGTLEILQAALDLGVHRVISKPFDMNDLAPMVAQAYASGA
jgi:two-component system C4-dicarboxylate transport response regulator DctD